MRKINIVKVHPGNGKLVDDRGHLYNEDLQRVNSDGELRYVRHNPDPFYDMTAWEQFWAYMTGRVNHIERENDRITQEHAAEDKARLIKLYETQGKSAYLVEVDRLRRTEGEYYYDLIRLRSREQQQLRAGTDTIT